MTRAPNSDLAAARRCEKANDRYRMLVEQFGIHSRYAGTICVDNDAATKAAKDYPVVYGGGRLANTRHHLATTCANHVQPADHTPSFTMITTPTPLQRRAFELLGVSHRLGYL